jgi:hypothetical protein
VEVVAANKNIIEGFMLKLILLSLFLCVQTFAMPDFDGLQSTEESSPSTEIDFVEALAKERRNSWEIFAKNELKRTKQFEQEIQDSQLKFQISEITTLFMNKENDSTAYKTAIEDFSSSIFQLELVSELLRIWDFAPMNVRAALEPAMQKIWSLFPHQRSLTSNKNRIERKLQETYESLPESGEQETAQISRSDSKLPGYGQLSIHYFYKKGKKIKSNVGVSDVMEYPKSYSEDTWETLLVPKPLDNLVNLRYKCIWLGTETVREEGKFVPVTKYRVLITKGTKLTTKKVKETIFDWYELWAMNKWYGIWFSRVGYFYVARETRHTKEFLSTIE